MSRHSSFHGDTTIFNLLSEVLGDEAKDSLGAAGIPWWQLLGDNSHVKGFLHPQYRSETEQSELGPNGGIDYWPILHIGTDYTVREVTYIHVLLDLHNIIWANGLETESFHPANALLGDIEAGEKLALLALLPQIATHPDAYGQHARRNLSASEAAILRYGLRG